MLIGDPLLAKTLADLRMQVNALEVSAQNTSLPETLNMTRKTIRWSAFVIALALIVSSLIKLRGDGQIDKLEQRVDQLERSAAKR